MKLKNLIFAFLLVGLVACSDKEEVPTAPHKVTLEFAADNAVSISVNKQENGKTTSVGIQTGKVELTTYSMEMPDITQHPHDVSYFIKVSPKDGNETTTLSGTLVIDGEAVDTEDNFTSGDLEIKLSNVGA